MDLGAMNASEFEPDWKKVERDMKKVGLKNGLSDGRDSNFQSSFDKGYKDGFQNGFELGKLNFQRTNCKNAVSAETSEHLDNASKAMCVLCGPEKDNEYVNDIRQKQADLVERNVTKIRDNLNGH